MPDKLSRQRRYQFRHRELGLCWLCPEKVYRACLCRKHYQMRRIENREKYHRDNPGSRRYLNAKSYQIGIDKAWPGSDLTAKSVSPDSVKSRRGGLGRSKFTGVESRQPGATRKQKQTDAGRA